MYKKRIYNFFIRVFLSLLLFFFITFLYDNNIGVNMMDKYIFNSNIDFSYIRSKTKRLFGNIILNKDTYVVSEKLEYKSVDKINNSFRFNTDTNYVIKNIKSGTVTHIDDDSVTIDADNGVTYIYSNLENISINLYDYISDGIIIGSVKEDYFILTLKKDDKYLDYEDYI